MKQGLFYYTSEFLAVLTIVIGIIQFLLFSLVGIEYDPESGSGLVAFVQVACCLYTMAWVLLNEMFGPRTVHNEKWPYFFPIFIFLSYFIESAFCEGLSLQSFPGRQFIFFCVGGVPAIYLATYIYRHERFDIITRNSDIIMLICTIALILNLPNMIGSTLVSIGGAGGHQAISYSAAFCFAINYTNILSKNVTDRFSIFTTRFMRVVFIILLPIQATACFLGGGRGGSLMLVVALILGLFLFARERFTKSLILSVITIAVFAFVSSALGLFQEGFGRAFDYIQGGRLDLTSNESDVIRTALREQSYDLIATRPVLGYGLWNGLKVAGYYMHNVFLDVLISGGFVYLMVFLYILKRSYKSAYILLTEDKTKCMLFPCILYPSVLLLFSGFYLKTGLFLFFLIYCLLNSRIIRRYQ